MPKEYIKVGTTSRRVAVFLQDSTNSNGSGLTGLTHSSSGLQAAYWRSSDGNAGATAITLASATLGTFTSGGFVEKDSTKMPGTYEFHIPNAAFASGADWVVIYLSGATNQVPVKLEFQLVGFDPANGTNLGLTGIPNGDMAIAKNVARPNFVFPMTSSSTHQMVSGLSVTCQVSKDAGSLAASANAVTDIGGGFYAINFTQSETDCDVIALKFSGSGADDLPLTVLTQPT